LTGANIEEEEEEAGEEKGDKRGWQEVRLSISTIYDGMSPEFLLRDDSGVIERDDRHP
jgi:hypothetical protein